jgi:MOSC domain-containing protein YiiM
MWSMAAGSITGIYIASAEGGDIRSVDAVDAVPGRGLVGDRYYAHAADEADHDPGTEVTLIASEGLERARAEKGLELKPGEHRRNLVTEGVNLDELIGAEFTVGNVRLKGIRSNPPCRYLEDLTGKKLVKPLIDAGGVRAQILAGGIIKVGDTVA